MTPRFFSHLGTVYRLDDITSIQPASTFTDEQGVTTVVTTAISLQHGNGLLVVQGSVEHVCRELGLTVPEVADEQPGQPGQPGQSGQSGQSSEEQRTEWAARNREALGG